MAKDITRITSTLADIAADVRAEFGGLTPAQLNWKPGADSWSVAQCLDHLIKTNTEMLPAINKKIAGARNSLWEQWSPLTGFFGGFLSKAMPKDDKKYKAPSKTIVPPSNIDADVVERFEANQAIVIEKIKALSDMDWERSVITSPFMGLMTYRISDGVVILVEHEKRHVRQAKRVMQAPAFPASEIAAV